MCDLITIMAGVSAAATVGSAIQQKEAAEDAAAERAKAARQQKKRAKEEATKSARDRVSERERATKERRKSSSVSEGDFLSALGAAGQRSFFSKGA